MTALVLARPSSALMSHPRLCSHLRRSQVVPLMLAPPWNANASLDQLTSAGPFAVPLVAFVGYDSVISATTWFVDTFSPGQWSAVDGGASQVQMIQPTMNGIVVPTVSIALATLSAATIQTLRQRQVSLRACLNKEACLLDLLTSALTTILDGPHRVDERHEALRLAGEYARRVIGESSRGVDLKLLERVGAADSELRGLSRLLHTSPAIREGVFHEGGLEGFTPRATPHATASTSERSQDADAAVNEPRFFLTTEFNSQALVKELMLLRGERLALLTTTFPRTHWLTIFLAAVSIVVAFLVESDDQALLFLDRLQLRLMFALLVGALSGIGIILADLNDPFGGSCCIAPATGQLEAIRTDVEERRRAADDARARAAVHAWQEAGLAAK